MRKHRWRPLGSSLLALAGAVGGLAVATPCAQASGFSVARFSGEHGHPTTDNPTALYFNPAALRGKRAELLVDGLVAYRSASYTRTRQPTDAPDVAGAEGANVGRATLDNFLFNPSLWLALPLSERWLLAAGVFTPFGGPVSWDTRAELARSPHPGIVDGVTRFHSMEALFTTSYASLGASFAATPRLRFGLALNTMYTRIDDVRAWSGGSNGVVGEGRSLLEVDGVDFGFAAGAFYEAEAVRIGASYQSRPNVSGGSRLHGKLSNNIGGPSSADVELHQDLPDIVRLGLAYRARRNVELRLFGAWERWSAFERQCVTQAGEECELNGDGSQPNGAHVLQNVPRDFHDAFDVRGGVSVWPWPALEVFSGIGVMSQAVPERTLETSLPDFVGVTFALGAKYRVSEAFSVAGSLSHLVSPARNAESTLQDGELPSQLPSASGHYTQDIGFLDLNLAVRF